MAPVNLWSTTGRTEWPLPARNPTSAPSFLFGPRVCEKPGGSFCRSVIAESRQHFRRIYSDRHRNLVFASRSEEHELEDGVAPLIRAAFFSFETCRRQGLQEAEERMIR